MERLPGELWLRIFCLLDHPNLATALQVCRKWNQLASDDTLWCKLFKDRWGGDIEDFSSPVRSSSSSSKTWKDMYEVRDRRDRVGLGKKIVREGRDYHIIDRGEIQHCLGSRKRGNSNGRAAEQNELEIVEKILFFVGDLEMACADAKHTRT